jgi:hypothetical protein
MAAEKPTPPLEQFIDSLEPGEKELLQNYAKRQCLEVLSANFDKLTGAKNATNKADS